MRDLQLRGTFILCIAKKKQFGGMQMSEWLVCIAQQLKFPPWEVDILTTDPHWNVFLLLENLFRTDIPTDRQTQRQTSL